MSFNTFSSVDDVHDNVANLVLTHMPSLEMLSLYWCFDQYSLFQECINIITIIFLNKTVKIKLVSPVVATLC